MCQSASTGLSLLDLPPEIRNQIYDEVFANEAKEVDLLTGMPPSKALLITCRDIYDEAKLLYRTAYRQFWSKTTFTLPTDESGWRDMTENETHISAMNVDDLAHITRIRIECESSDRAMVVFNNGVWARWFEDNLEVQDVELIEAEPWNLAWMEVWYTTDARKVRDRQVLWDAGFRRVHDITSLLVGFDVRGESWARVTQAKSLTGFTGLSKEHLLHALTE